MNIEKLSSKRQPSCSEKLFCTNHYHLLNGIFQRNGYYVCSFKKENDYCKGIFLGITEINS